MKRVLHNRLGRLRQRGVVGLLAVIFLLVVVSLAAVTLLSMSSSDLHDTTAQNEGVAALFAAETGIERASELYATGTPCSAALLPPPAPAAAMAIDARASFQSTTTVPVPLAGPTRCRLQVVGRVGKTTRTIQADLALGSSGLTFISTASGTKINTNAAPLPWSHTIPATAGPNRIVLVAVSLRRAGGTEAVVAGPQTTYGGLPLIPLGGVDHPVDGVRVEWLYLLNPPVGNSPIRVLISPGARASGRSIAFSGVDQVTPIDAGPVSASNNLPMNPSVGLVTVTDKARVVDTLAVRLAASASAGPGQTVPGGWNATVGGGTTGVFGAGSYMAAKSPAGAVSPGWTVTGSPPPPLNKGWVYSALALRPGGRVYVLNWQEL